MDNLVVVEVAHAHGNLLGPADQLLGRDLLAFAQQVEQWAVRAVLHDDAEAGRLGTHTPD